MKEKINKAFQSVDWGQIITLLVFTIIIGAIVYGLQKANFNDLAKIAKGGR